MVAAAAAGDGKVALAAGYNNRTMGRWGRGAHGGTRLLARTGDDERWVMMTDDDDGSQGPMSMGMKANA